MGADIRVLIADDSAVIRGVLKRTLEAAPGITVAGTAFDGMHAVRQASELQPDVVILDVEMPILDGLAALPRILEAAPGVPVVMYSTLTRRGASAAIDALSKGASDYATKPSNTGSAEDARRAVEESLLPLVRTWGTIGQSRHLRGARPAAASAAPRPRFSRARRQPSAILVGCSTGGPNALATVFGALPTLAVPVLVVQHMPEIFTELLAQRLNSMSPMPVSEAADGVLVQPGHVYVAKGGRHMTLRRTGADVHLRLDDGPPENFCKPAVDVLFRSGVETWGGSLAAYVLTGMGSDGLAGARGIREAGGSVHIQDEASSVIWGMPGAIAGAGIADEVLPLNAIAASMAELASASPMVKAR